MKKNIGLFTLFFICLFSFPVMSMENIAYNFYKMDSDGHFTVDFDERFTVTDEELKKLLEIQQKRELYQLAALKANKVCLKGEQRIQAAYSQAMFDKKKESYKLLLGISSEETLTIHNLSDRFKSKFNEINNMPIEALISMRINELSVKMKDAYAEQENELKNVNQRYDWYENNWQHQAQKDQSMRMAYYADARKKELDFWKKTFASEIESCNNQLRRLSDYQRLIDSIKVKVQHIKQQYKEDYSLPLQEFKARTSFGALMHQEYPQETKEILSYINGYRYLLLKQLTNAYNTLLIVV